MIFRLLRSAPEISGEDIAEVLGVSRAMVHKEIARMRAQGMRVQARPRCGYRLVCAPEAPLPWAVRGYWPAQRDWPVEFVPQVVSTMEIAHQRAQQGAPGGSVVTADHQSGGRGRRGRSWETAPGEALLASIVLRPRIQAAQAGLLPLAAAVGASRAVARVAGATPAIKWPNDLLLEDRKLAGILLELTLAEQDVRYAVAGIGLNARQTVFPHAVRDRAISLRQATGWQGSRAELLAALVEEVVEMVEVLERDPETVRRAWLARNCTSGRGVRVATAAGEVSGTALGIDDLGRLRVRTATGEETCLAAGDVTLSAEA